MSSQHNTPPNTPPNTPSNLVDQDDERVKDIAWIEKLIDKLIKDDKFDKGKTSYWGMNAIK